MATSPSLFGGSMSPQEMQAQLLNQRAAQFAQLDPDQQLGMMAYKAASNLGTGLAGAFGVNVQDPTIQRATRLRELAGQYNTNTAAGLRQMADALRTQDPDMALQLSQRAAAMDLEAAKLSSEQALTTQRTREKEAADPFQKLVQSGKYTPASLAEYQKSGKPTDLVLYEKPTETTKTSYGAEAERVSQELYKKPFSDLTQPQMAAVNKRVEESTKKGTTVNVSLAGQEKFSEKMGELDAKRVADALTVRDNAFTTIRSLDQLATLDDQGLISGSFATGRVGATNLLNTLGLASPKDQQRLASSQNYQKVAGDVILGVLGGKLGAGFSNEDRKFIEGLVPQLETSPAARRQLINFMRRKNMDIAEEATRLETYARNKNGLKGFNPKLPIGANIPATALSADELAKAAGGKIVNGKFVPNK
jgi:hypothetical protein